MARWRPGTAVAGLCLLLFLRQAAARLRVSGSDLYDGETRIKFKGIGVTCTEYMLKLNMDDAGKGEWPGHWAYKYCFGGPPSASSHHIELNKEPEYLLRYLLPDSRGGSFQTRPTVKKVDFEAPYSEAVHPSAAEARPVVRIPMTGSLYLYETNRAMYRAIIDELVQAFTSRGVAVILDLHWNCPDTSEMQSCTGAQAASMALRHFGSEPGAVAFWDAISKKYAGNELVLYELFNEPWIMEYDTWYGGSHTNAGMKEMYEAIRKNAPDGIVIIGGKDQYALDAQSGLAFYLQYKEEAGNYPTNILWNVHPYVGLSQGLEHSLSSALRIALALKTIGPVIFTEFGQYCCGGTGDPCSGQGSCSDEKHGAFFVHNVINMAEQYDISWVGWAWRGSGVNNAHRPCLEGMAECNQPDIRDIDNGTGQVVLTDGSHAGADWRTAWATFVAPETRSIEVQDVHQTAFEKADSQPAGFLPRPCIVDKFNLGNVCGWNGGDDVLSLSPSVFTKQSIYTSILPGLPGSCEAQGCGDFRCDTYTGPCKGKSSGSPAQQQQQQPQQQQQRQQQQQQQQQQQPQSQVSTTAAPQSSSGMPSTAAGAVASARAGGGVQAAQTTQSPLFLPATAQGQVTQPVQPPLLYPGQGQAPLASGPALPSPVGLTAPPTLWSGGAAAGPGLLPATMAPFVPALMTTQRPEAGLLPQPSPSQPSSTPSPGTTAPASAQAVPLQQRATTSPSTAASTSAQAYCCFSWSDDTDACCSCYDTSRTKPGDWCGVSEERCTGCSGGHAHYCPAGCSKDAPAATIQRDGVPAAGELLLTDTRSPGGRSSRRVEAWCSALALSAAAAGAVALAARLAVPFAVWRRRALGLREEDDHGTGSGAGGRLLHSYEHLQQAPPLGESPASGGQA